MNRKISFKLIVYSVVLLLFFALFQDVLIRWTVQATKPDIPREVIVLSEDEVIKIDNPEVTSFDEMMDFVKENIEHDEIISVSVLYNQTPVVYEITLLI